LLDGVVDEAVDGLEAALEDGDLGAFCKEAVQFRLFEGGGFSKERRDEAGFELGF
jgi:hypothetical protein